MIVERFSVWGDDERPRSPARSGPPGSTISASIFPRVTHGPPGGPSGVGGLPGLSVPGGGLLGVPNVGQSGGSLNNLNNVNNPNVLQVGGPDEAPGGRRGSTCGLSLSPQPSPKGRRRSMIAELVNPGGGGGLPKFKQGPPSPLELNPISQHCEIGRLVGSAGPELVWKIYDAKRKSDNKLGSGADNNYRTVFREIGWGMGDSSYHLPSHHFPDSLSTTRPATLVFDVFEYFSQMMRYAVSTRREAKKIVLDVCYARHCETVIQFHWKLDRLMLLKLARRTQWILPPTLYTAVGILLIEIQLLFPDPVSLAAQCG
ncbi:SCY1 protein 2-like [Tropilaelaps mercedesae]|uniref:SCY1 protein 2-like n=1 Tax=Tropilaelaps mercedesae TaxID=418985 RepID=A0A1V9XLD4_9ACAR|nr:SCY1 protein 2-like [Tropilaelaps mercedesae]